MVEFLGPGFGQSRSLSYGRSIMEQQGIGGQYWYGSIEMK
jgi:hypothetical protein